MIHRAWCCLGEVPYCFSRSSVKFQGHTALKIVEFDPDWAFPDCNSSLNSPMAKKWCTKLEVALKRYPIVFQGHPSNFKVTRLKKIVEFDPNWEFPDCNSSLNSPMATKLCLKEKENQHSFAGLLNIYSSGIWLWYMQSLFINQVKQNRGLKSENPQPMVIAILPPCSGKQMWMWCSVVSSPAWWLINPSPIPEAARCQLLLRAGRLRYLNVSARKLPPKLLRQEMINVTHCFSNKLHKKYVINEVIQLIWHKHTFYYIGSWQIHFDFFLCETCKEMGL